MTNTVDTHDPAGMARWLRERAEAAHEFLSLDSEAQQRQYLNKWQQTVLPHLAFRFKQAATMVEDLNTKRQQAEHERDCAIERVAQLQNDIQELTCGDPRKAHHCSTCQCPEIEAASQ